MGNNLPWFGLSGSISGIGGGGGGGLSSHNTFSRLSDPHLNWWRDCGVGPARCIIPLTLVRLEDVICWQRQWRLFTMDYINFVSFFGKKKIVGSSSSGGVGTETVDQKTLFEHLAGEKNIVRIAVDLMNYVLQGNLEDSDSNHIGNTSTSLSLAGLTLMLEKICSGICKVCTGIPILPRLYIRAWAATIMRSAVREQSGSMTKAEYEGWWMKDFHVRKFLRIFLRHPTDEENLPINNQMVNYFNLIRQTENLHDHDDMILCEIKKSNEAQKLCRFKSSRHVFVPKEVGYHYIFIPNGLWQRENKISGLSQSVSSPSKIMNLTQGLGKQFQQSQSQSGVMPMDGIPQSSESDASSITEFIASTHENTIYWPNGNSTAILPGKRAISTFYASAMPGFSPSKIWLKGKMMTFELRGGNRIFWSDGDVWKLNDI